MTRIHICSAIAAVALGLGTAFGAPAAVAKPVSNSTLKSECKDAGGTWESVPDGNGGTESSCKYRDIDGHQHIDYYKNGNFLGTDNPK
jgi:hypothetical protein